MFEKLSEYLDREIDDTTFAAMQEHMADCPACLSFLESLRRTVGHIGRSPSARLPEDWRREIVSAYERTCRDHMD
jgi:anti-sigma factor RsiW